MLSKKAKYALKALTVLCREIHQPSVGIAEIARQENIPHKFLESILRELRLEGYLTSKRGKGGGYALFRKPESISVGEIIRLMDGRAALTACASSRDGKACSDCVMPHRCTIRPLMVNICKTTDRMLDCTSLLDIVRQEMEWSPVE